MTRIPKEDVESGKRGTRMARAALEGKPIELDDEDVDERPRPRERRDVDG